FRIYHSESGKKWIFSNTGLFLLDKQAGIFREFREPLPVNEFKGSGYLCWAWYGEGIYIYDLNEAKFSHIPHDNSQLVKSILCQNKNLVWFSNSSMTGAPLGLSRVVFTPDYFKNYLLSADKYDSPAVYAIASDKQQRIWVGMRGKNQLIRITPDLKTITIDIPKHFTSPDPGAIRSLTLVPDGLWVGYFRELLLFYDFTTAEFTKYLTGGLGFRPLAIDKEGDLYLAGAKNNNSALIHFSPQLKRTKETIDISYSSPIYKILIDKNDIVWCGLHFSRITRFDPKTEKTDLFLLSKGNYNVEDICEGDNGDLWMALLGAGVCNFDPATGRKNFYTTSDGLANNMTYSILKDDSGNIWVSTNTGISRINPITGKIRTFGPSEGLNIIEFNSGASSIGENGEFYMGGMGGLVSFFPDIINVDEMEAGEQKIIITELRVSNEPRIFKLSAHRTDTIILKKGENNLRLYFSSSDFINSDKTVYRYKLSKINTDWVEADSRSRNASYSNLKPGWYDFHLQATDRTGSWNASKEIRIRIMPLYYQTLFFRITVPVAVLLLAGSMIFIYIRQLKQREAQKQAALRLQSLRGQMNPHFIFNSLNSINYFISKNDKLSANRYI
ncbi:MAG: triple tyrosine motif-containing protein, partial [Bacteroidales bacterium]